MQISKKRSKQKKYSSSHNVSVNNDSSSIFYESRFEKLKPFLKVVVILLAIAGAVYVAYVSMSSQSKDTVRTVENQQTVNEGAGELDQCIETAWDAHPTPGVDSRDFYPKMIAGYDAQLVCYDTYPDENSAVARLSIESARESAIDASGTYKEVYLSSNPYEYKSSPSSGSDRYDTPYRPNEGSSTGGDTSVGNNTTQAPGDTRPVVDTQWCSTQKTLIDNTYEVYHELRTRVQSIDTQLQKVSTARPPGFTGTQSQLDAWRASERQRLVNERSPLVSQQQDTFRMYEDMQREYISKTCY